MAKKAHKKPVHAAHKAAGHKSKKSNKGVIVAVIIAVLVIAGVAAYFTLFNDPVVATVNGEPVYKSEVNDQLEGLQAQYGEAITEDIALNQTIIEKLLMQEAKKQGIMVTDETLDAFIDDSLARSGQTRESFDATLKAQNMSFEKIRERIRVQMAITELVNKTFSNIEVPEKDVKAFYDQNKQLFEGQTYTDVKGQISDYLKSQEQVKAFQQYVLDLRANADIQVK